MHLHACTRRLGIDLIGFVDNGDGRLDVMLRSPGLRPRHLMEIAPSMPKGVITRGLDVVFPGRFTVNGQEGVVRGGRRLDGMATRFQGVSAANDEGDENDNDEEDWDSLDQEEVEAMKDISSAFDIRDMDDVDIEQYPRFVVRNFGNLVGEGQRVDALLKLLLPASKVVYDKQQKDKEAAMVAAELREKRERLKQNKRRLDRKDGILLQYD